MKKCDVNINGVGILVNKQPFEVLLWLESGIDCRQLNPEQAEALAAALLAAANVARENKVQNDNYQADSQTR